MGMPLTESQRNWRSKRKTLRLSIGTGNTPDGEVDLTTSALHSHNPYSYHTKTTTVGMSEKGMQLWLNFVERICGGDQELMDYLQMIAGEIIIGKVFCENLIIAYGKGGNGKSTFFNVLSRVLGDYAGQISADSLTTGRQNKKIWELGELKGKRLVVASELEEGTRLSDSLLKRICSTDKILGERKFQMPFSFTPSHTTVLHTNHLPRVGSTDFGTWRRIIVIPFETVIEHGEDIKNYAEVLYAEAGEAVLFWAIQGAVRYVKADYNIEVPACVKRAVDAYREESDWLEAFMLEYCEIGASFIQKAGDLYKRYRDNCIETGEFARSSQDFATALKNKGFQKQRKSSGSFYYGFHLR